ncbi:ABC transporter ATP-binding protein [Brucella haematophila]|uniref:ABC transporter ATP-binding protein n=1 Tax=Brucella haematophila TaxID=419474 RepID=UPI00110DE5FA|nr:ABC transporter ATP-binding protein [Brucella haematophila]TMV04540.1 ABC transporter ATP-binding protein [Brucella haematophila]
MNMMTSTETLTHSNAVEVGNLSKSYGSGKSAVRILDNLGISVAQGEMLVLLGPSGCGKTTLLRCIVGLEQPDSGRIELGSKIVVDTERGLVLPPDKRGVGMVFQNYALWPHMTVAQNVAFPLKCRKQAAEIGRGRVQEALDVVQCGHLAERYPSQLSGGQQQRVALARALASRPQVMLMDEPLSNLDALLRVDLRSQLHQLHKKLGFTGIYVTHDQNEAISLGTRVVVMRAGQMEQIGAPMEIYSRPANEYVAEFLGLRNALSVRVDEHGLMFVGKDKAQLPANFLPAGEYRLRMRPVDLVMANGREENAGNRAWIDGTVLDSISYCDISEVTVDIGGHSMLVEGKGLGSPEVGQSVRIGIDLEQAKFFRESRLASTRFLG